MNEATEYHPVPEPELSAQDRAALKLAKLIQEAAADLKLQHQRVQQAREHLGKLISELTGLPP